MGILTIPLIKNDSFLSHFFIYIIFLLMFTVFNQLSFNTSLLVLLEVKLCDKIIKFSSNIEHLCPPVDWNVKPMCLFLIDDITSKVRKNSRNICIFESFIYSQLIRTQLFLVMVTPHVLAITAFLDSLIR